KYGSAADYLMTNAHRRPILMKMNLRELYHFVRLRDDQHAQWDIRALARGLMVEIHPRLPLSAMLLCGKSNFAGEFEKQYQRPPRMVV
ncbi:MAG: thymidylate synthase, partial [Geobacteraceae bacterium]